ncbi:MAG: MFS transporter [Chloroflexia bacterium]
MAATREADLPIAARPTQHSALRTPHFIWLNLFWFANNLHWGALLSIVVPSQVDKLFGNKELNYPLVVVGGTLAAVIVHPLAGALSDRTTARLGRRRPWLLWGTLPNLVGLGLMAIAPSVPLLALGYLVVQVANNAVNAPWSAVIADQVPAAQRGAASGWNGLLTVAGTVVGSLVGGLIVSKDQPLDEYRVKLVIMYGLIAAVQAAVVLITAWRVRETPLATARPFGRADLARTYWVSPSAGRDFFWVCLTRFMMQQGMWGIFFFLQYYFDDVLGLPGERTMGTLFLPVVMVAAMTTVYFAGALSDRHGRKPLVYLSGALMSVVCFGFMLVQHPIAVPVCALLFGIGYGAYTSVDWALACDVLPDDQEYGRDMGIWAIAGILPQIFGIVLGGITLAFFKTFPNHLGYTILFVFTLVWFILGTVLIRRVKQVR